VWGLAASYAKAAKRFLGKALNGLKDWEQPTVINTDKAPTYGIAIAQLKAEGKCPGGLVHRQVKYLNNVVEADQGKLKQLIKPRRQVRMLVSAASISDILISFGSCPKNRMVALVYQGYRCLWLIKAIYRLEVPFSGGGALLRSLSDP